jgi:hypothetical protein
MLQLRRDPIKIFRVVALVEQLDFALQIPEMLASKPRHIYRSLKAHAKSIQVDVPKFKEIKGDRERLLARLVSELTVIYPDLEPHMELAKSSIVFLFARGGELGGRKDALKKRLLATGCICGVSEPDMAAWITFAEQCDDQNTALMLLEILAATSIIGDKKMNIHINGDVGVLNTGEIRDVQSINANVNSLVESGHKSAAEALTQLTEAITSSTELSDTDRTEMLQQLNELSRQAASPESERSRGVAKAILGSVAATLGAAGGLAEVWSTWGPQIAAFFGKTE